MSTPLQDRVAAVTGASSGIGAASAIHLARAGAAVAVIARRADRLDSLAGQITAAGGRVLSVPLDITDRAAVDTGFARIASELGAVDLLVNNAGVMPLSPVTALRVDDWDWMLDVNVRGLLYCVAAVLPGLVARGKGHIINVGSVAGRRPLPSGVVYAATKYAVRAISDGLRLELSSTHGIRVTDLEPGVVATELTEHIPDDDVRRGFQTRWADKTPLSPDDVAGAVVWAASQPEHVNVNEILLRPTDQPT